MSKELITPDEVKAMLDAATKGKWKENKHGTIIAGGATLSINGVSFPMHTSSEANSNRLLLLNSKKIAKAYIQLSQEHEALKQWKESMLEVSSSYDIQAIGKEIGVKLGLPIHCEILPHIQKQAEQIDALRNATIDECVESLLTKAERESGIFIILSGLADELLKLKARKE